MSLAVEGLQVLLQGGGGGPRQVSLDLEVAHGEEDLVVFQQRGHQHHRRGREVLLEVARVVRSPPVLLLAHQLPLEGGEAAAALLLLAPDKYDRIYVLPFTIILSI